VGVRREGRRSLAAAVVATAARRSGGRVVDAAAAAAELAARVLVYMVSLCAGCKLRICSREAAASKRTGVLRHRVLLR